MLNTVFKDAIINREKTLSILKGPEYDKIIQKAKENWIDYKPEKQEKPSQFKILCVTHLELPMERLEKERW